MSGHTRSHVPDPGPPSARPRVINYFSPLVIPANLHLSTQVVTRIGEITIFLTIFVQRESIATLGHLWEKY